MVKILHINLKGRGETEAEFRFFWDNLHEYESRTLFLADIAELNERADTDYYTRIPVDYAQTGQVLFNWLDGTDRALQSALKRHKREQIVIAIATSKKLANLPWELLHDGQSFLVNRKPAIVPVRWLADRQRLTIQNDPKNRFLNVVFMATSPRGVTPELDFEAEEGQILSATKGTKKNLCLTVEESGCLENLGELVNEVEEPFDVVHLTGHAEIKQGQPYFITEDEYGDRLNSSTEDIATVLQFNYPKLIFLSGCRTGYSPEDVVPSMAEDLLNQGATAVLSWGDRVGDKNASVMAAKLYGALSTGLSVTEAIALTYQTLLKQEQLSRVTDRNQWHLLRFYVADALPGALVTKPTASERQPAPPLTVTDRFIDAQKRLRLLSRSEFVGRRRQLQNSLRVLKIDEQKIGVLLCGMGGWGKSTIAARLCDRLSNYQTIIWWRKVDDGYFIRLLADKFRSKQWRQKLIDSSEYLKYRLRDIFAELNQAGEKPFLLVFDDFEWNLEPRGDGYILQTNVVKVLESLIWAIRETGSGNRLIITCRYRFDWDWTTLFFVQHLDNFHHTDLLKKLRRLENFNSDKIDESLIARSLKLADGNPRLLEWLDRDVLPQENAAELLTEYESRADKWQDRVIWNQENTPKLQIDKPLEKILGLCLVYELPVPMDALEVVCEGQRQYKEQLQRAINLGLIEVSSEVEESNRTYRVSRILPRIISTVELPPEPDIYPLYRKAWEILSELWGNIKNENEEQWREIFRLKLADKNNLQRFRDGFEQMLKVQYNRESDRAFEAELRKRKYEINRSSIGENLEALLQQHRWRESDEETAWIFYQIMVCEEFEDFNVLCEEFPVQELNEIDALWVKYSQGQFGFSVQKKIYQSLGGTDKYDYDTWKQFGERVKWYDGQLWLTYESLLKKPIQSVTLEVISVLWTTRGLTRGGLPALWTTRGRALTRSKGWEGVGGASWLRLRYIGQRWISLLSHQCLTDKI